MLPVQQSGFDLFLTCLELAGPQEFQIEQSLQLSLSRAIIARVSDLNPRIQQKSEMALKIMKDHRLWKHQ